MFDLTRNIELVKDYLKEEELSYEDEQIDDVIQGEGGDITVVVSVWDRSYFHNISLIDLLGFIYSRCGVSR